MQRVRTVIDVELSGRLIQCPNPIVVVVQAVANQPFQQIRQGLGGKALAKDTIPRSFPLFKEQVEKVVSISVPTPFQQNRNISNLCKGEKVLLAGVYATSR